MNRLRFLLSLLVRHAASYALGVVAIGLTLWMSLAIPRFLQDAIDILESNPDPAGDAFLGKILWILFFAVAIIFVRTASRLLFFTPGRKVEYQLKNDLLRHLTRLQRDYFLANPTGSIISRINNDINGVRMLMGFGLMGLVNSVGMLSLAPIYMYQISPRLTLYVALPIAVAFMLLQVAVRKLRAEQMKQMKAMQDLSDFTVESYNGIDVLKSFRGFVWAQGQFEAQSRSVRDSAIRMSNIRAFFLPLLTHIANGLKVMLVLVGGVMVINNELSIGGFMAYALYLAMLVPPLMGMTWMMFVIQRGVTALVSLEQVFNTLPGLPAVNPQARQALPSVLQEGLEVRGLTHAYADDPHHPVLSDLSFQVRPGEIVGVFGGIGSGKSTLVNLINGYLSPPPGTVTLDGLDVNDLGQDLLREHVVTVTQEPFLFSESVRENIAFAAQEATDDEVALAARHAALDTDINLFPQGMETLVGEKGITLSGGQKQRISLARTLLKPCDLLVLDDVLSAVDHETERYLIERIYQFEHARSLLLISHRISALERASRILVLEAGRMVDQGTHEELIQREGDYRQAWLFQSEQEMETRDPADPPDGQKATGRGTAGQETTGGSSPTEGGA